MSTLQKLETDLSTVRLDFNSGVTTGLQLLGDVDLGAVDPGSIDPDSLQSTEFPDPVKVAFRVLLRSVDIDTARTYAQQIATELATPGPYKVQITGMASALYFDAVGSSVPGLFRGQADAVYKIATLLMDPDGFPVTLLRLPYLYAAKLRSSANLTTNATLLKATTTANRPDLWAWTSTSGITGETIDWTNQAYSFAAATTSTLLLQQTTPNSSMTGGATYTFSFYARASAPSIASFYAQWQGLDNSGTVQGAASSGTPVSLTTSWQRVTVSAAANASATKAQLRISMQNAAATSVTVYLRYVQFEQAAAVTDFRAGTETVSNNPAAALGRIMPVYVQGNAPTRAILTITPESGANIVQARVARRSYGNLTEFANSNHFTQAESMTAGTNTTLAVADAAASGTTARIWNGAGGTDAWAKRLRWQVAPADKTSIEGSYRVYARLKANSVLTSGNGALYWLQLRWSAGNSDPVSFSNDVVPLDLTDISTDQFNTVDLGSVFVERGLATTYGLTFELWAKREQGENGNIYVDHVTLIPQGPTATNAQDQSMVLATRGWRDTDGGNLERWLGSDLVTPTSTSSTVTSGDVDGDSVLLDHNGAGAGTPPVAGFTVATGRHSWMANVTVTHKVGNNPGQDVIGEFRIRNVTDSTNARTKTIGIRSKLARLRKRVTLVDAVTSGAKSYQGQVHETSANSASNNESITVHSISHYFTRTVTSSNSMLASGEYGLVSGRPVAQVTASSVAVEPLRKQGAWIDLAPGLNLLVFDWGEVPTVGYEQVDSREPLALSTYNRSCTVACDMYPRYTA